MRRPKNLLAAGLIALLVACTIAWYTTRDAGPSRIVAKQRQATLIDDRLLQTAHQFAAIADTADEQGLAREALRLSDHELDQAFATALREAAIPSPPASGPLKQLADQIALLKAQVAAEQTHVAQLTKQAATNDAAGGQLELAKAQVALDQDELNDAQQDLARQGGDPHAKLERALQEHEAAQHEAAQPPALAAAGRTSTLSEQIRLWFSLRGRESQLAAARQQAANHTSALEREHNTLETRTNNKPDASTSTGSAAAPSAASDAATPGDDGEEDTTATVALLRRMSDQKKTLAELDQRIQDSQQLADVYKRWSTAVETRRRGVLHLLLGSLAAVLAILLTVVATDRAIRRALGQETNRRRLRTLRVMADVGVQFAGVVLILLIVFGPPSQMSTMIGLATAGLTVVLKDFIVAFFGWFVLMGRNGIHVGDWVEIQGVGGEVIEIGLLRTVLLEMGNWTNSGHPTGRRVAFVNSFAIEGHYFNFSTAGQWLWDELQVSVPAAGDPYQMAEQIRQIIERETETDANLAQQDWERVTHQYGIRPFSAKPAVDLRPSAIGLDIVVRYITHAPQRYEVKSRLFQAIVGLLHKPAGSPASPV
jgi:small-conductance mechanosensitive channel